MTRRLRALAAASTVLAATLLAPAAAAPPTVLRLSGRTTGYVDLTLARPATFDEWRARLTTRGTYVGWWLVKRGEPVTSKGNQAGGVNFVRQSDGPYPDYTLGFQTTALDPGRYRLYLATDGESTVEVPVSGLPRSLHLTPQRRTTSIGLLKTLDVLPGGIASGGMREAVDLPAESLVASSVLVASAPGVTVESLGACVVPPGGSCNDPGQPGGFSGYAMSLFTDFGVQVTVQYQPGSLPPGPHEGSQGATAGPGVVRVVGSLFQLTPVP